MNPEVPRVPQRVPGFLDGCLVEGNDPAQERRARNIKRRALALSILLQLACLAALILFPLLSRGERISLKDMTPVPPYAPYRHGDTQSNPERHTITRSCTFCVPHDYNHPIVTSDPTPPNTSANEPNDDSELSRYGDPNGRPIGILGSPSEGGPVKPIEEEVKKTVIRRKISEGIQAASLIRRVEPIYPALARQIRLEGQVELHAVISTDGRIESLEVISGHPLLVQSALQAVREWRYRPTILNGQPVEVDTHITVIYSLSH